MKSALFFLLSFCVVITLHAQSGIILQKKNGRQKEIRIKEKEQLVFYTSNGKWNNVKKITDSSITLSRSWKTERDTVYTWNIPPNKKHPDGILRKKQRVWQTDSVTCRLDEVLLVKRQVIRSEGLAHIAGWMMAGAILAVPLLPVAAIDEGSAGVHNWLLFEGVLVGVSGTSIGLLSLRKKYTLGEKWQLVAAHTK